MSDEFTICAAAFFRSVGKDVTTPEEFVMSTSLELKWMSPSDSKLMLKALLAKGILVQKGGFVRASSDLSAVDVPLAYRPSQDLLKLLRSAPAGPTPKKEQKEPVEPDMFHKLIDIARGHGIELKDFVPVSSRIQRELGIDISAAGLIVLRDKGVDISEISVAVHDDIVSN